jgi:hypothetical protein
MTKALTLFDPWLQKSISPVRSMAGSNVSQPFIEDTEKGI